MTDHEETETLRSKYTGSRYNRYKRKAQLKIMATDQEGNIEVKGNREIKGEIQEGNMRHGIREGYSRRLWLQIKTIDIRVK